MSYNIFHGELQDGQGRSSLKLIAEVINKFNPDFVALQEVDSMTARSAGLNNDIPMDLMKELSRMTGMYGYFGKAIDFSGGSYGLGILSRFPAAKSAYSLPDPMGGEKRALLTIRYKFPDGKKIVFASTHLCHKFEENRIAQTRTIRKILKKMKLPVIIGGDFNFVPESNPYKIIAGWFKDAALLKGVPQYTYPSDKPEERIDYVFLSGNKKWVVKDVEIYQTHASDHLPVIVTLELKSR